MLSYLKTVSDFINELKYNDNEIKYKLYSFLKTLNILNEYYDKIYGSYDKQREEIFLIMIGLYDKIKWDINDISKYEILTNDELTFLKLIEIKVFDTIQSKFMDKDF